MDFLKKHYEKILLGVVLLGMAVALALLPFKIGSEKQKLDDMATQLIHPKVKPLTNLTYFAGRILKRMASPALVDFAPARTSCSTRCRGKRRPTGTCSCAHSVGPNRRDVTNITPLYLELTLDSVTPPDPGRATHRHREGSRRQSRPAPQKQTFCG